MAGERERLRSAKSVLFLDVDGVLNDEPYFRHRDRKTDRGIYSSIDREKIALLNEVVERTGCIIVVSSSWRSDTLFRPYLRKRGAKVRFHRDWRTTRISDMEPHLRGREIAEWIGRNPIAEYAIVDDDNDMLPEQAERFVQTSFSTGLTKAHVERLVAVLAGRRALADGTGTGGGSGDGGRDDGPA